MPGPLGNSFEGSAETTDAIHAFCRHLGELCDVLTAPYDADALMRAATSHELQGTNCNVLLQNALYQWLGERVELSLSDEEKPEAAARGARESALAQIRNQDMLSEFMQAVVNTYANTDAKAEIHAERGKQSLLFDLQGPIDLLGPEEVDSLLSELANSDCPVGALEAISSDVHLLEDLCFGPTWPQLCDALGRLVCLPAAAVTSTAGGGVNLGPPASQSAQDLTLPRQQQLLLTILQELVSSSAASSPPHVAELLDALAPYMTALVLQLVLSSGSRSGGGGDSTVPPASGTAPSLLAAAASLDPFGVGLIRIAHQLLMGLAAEHHMLPPNCAALSARAVCDVVRAGLARGAPSPTPTAPAAAAGIGFSAAATSHVEGTVVDLSALDLLVLLDPELRWWQRLCSATHATQPIADAAAATQLAAALEAALQAWDCATTAGGSGSSGYNHSGVPVLVPAGNGMPSGGRSSTHLLACTALLGGLVRANNIALLATEPADDARGVSASALRPRALEGAASLTNQQHRLRLQRLLSHLVNCFCVALDKPWLLRPTARTTAAAVVGTAVAGTAHLNERGSGSIFLLLAADVLSSAAALGTLSLLAPTGASTSNSGVNAGGGNVTLTPILQAMLRAAATTAAACGGAVQGPGSNTSVVTASEAEAWLAAAAKVLGAAADYAVLAASSAVTADIGVGASREQLGQPAVADAMCGLLRHVAGRVRGCAAAVAAAAPAWAVQVIRAATSIATASPAVTLTLCDLYDTLHAVLPGKTAAGRSGPWSSLSRSPSPSRAGGRRSDGGGGGGTHSDCAPRLALIDLMDSGSRSVAEHSKKSASRERRCTEHKLDDLELLAAEAVLSYCRSDFGASRTVNIGEPAIQESASPQPLLRLQLPTGLQRQMFLECAARRLCEEYDRAGRSAEGTGGCRSASIAPDTRTAAAKRRVAQQAEALARSCLLGEQALIAAGFARRVLEDVALVLRSGEYESPYLQPLPYADPLAGLSAILASVLCWPGLLQLPELKDEGEGEGVRKGRSASAEVCAMSASLQLRHREEVLALLQELVTWLDSRGVEGGVLPPADAAAVSLQAFSALVASDASAGSALERDTNISWYLQNLCGMLPMDAEGACGTSTASGHGEEALTQQQQQQRPPQSDMLLDMAQVVLRAMVRPSTSTPAQSSWGQ